MTRAPGFWFGFKKGLLVLTFCVPSLTIVRGVTARVNKTAGGWQLFVEGQPTFVKGVCYNPFLFGENPHEGTGRDWMTVDDDKDGRSDFAYQTWIDVNGNGRQDSGERPQGDFALLHSLGCNVIRLYHHASANTKVQKRLEKTPAALLYNHPPEKKVLRSLWAKYGILVGMGDLLGAYTVGSGATWETGTDYTDARQRAAMLESVEDMVLEHKDEPYLLLWILGNENEYGDLTRTNAGSVPEEYAKFLGTVARRIHALDPHHPVCVALGETTILNAIARHAPDVDIIGINSYRHPGFGSLWNEVAQTCDRPVLLTEYGLLCPPFSEGRFFDEQAQADMHMKDWEDIRAHGAGARAPQNSIGGFAYEWSDSWWLEGRPALQDTTGEPCSREWHGLVASISAQGARLSRRLRPVYKRYQTVWSEPLP